MSLLLNGTEGVTYNDGTLQSSAPVGRNRIINGNMTIDQRNAGASVSIDATTSFPVDRFYAVCFTASTGATAQQSTTAPNNYTNSLIITIGTGQTLAPGDVNFLEQKVEGFNIADLGWGTASASTVTLSFWARSSLTGTFGGALQNSAGNRSYPFTYTISVANTWEQKSITVAGDTTGTWLTTNGVGIRLFWGLGIGSTYSGTAGAWAASNYISATGATSVVGTSSATFYITGVQLETGTTATDFENLQYTTQLSLCQRYFSKSYDYDVAPGTASTVVGSVAIRNGPVTIDGSPFWHITFPVAMRDNPTVTTFDYGGISGKVNGPSNASVTATTYQLGMSGFNVANTSGSSVSSGDYYCNWQAVSEL